MRFNKVMRNGGMSFYDEWQVRVTKSPLLLKYPLIRRFITKYGTDETYNYASGQLTASYDDRNTICKDLKDPSASNWADQLTCPGQPVVSEADVSYFSQTETAGSSVYVKDSYGPCCHCRSTSGLAMFDAILRPTNSVCKTSATEGCVQMRLDRYFNDFMTNGGNIVAKKGDAIPTAILFEPLPLVRSYKIYIDVAYNDTNSTSVDSDSSDIETIHHQIILKSTASGTSVGLGDALDAAVVDHFKVSLLGDLTDGTLPASLQSKYLAVESSQLDFLTASTSFINTVANGQTSLNLTSCDFSQFQSISRLSPAWAEAVHSMALCFQRMMLVPSFAYDESGETCDKIGVSFGVFRSGISCDGSNKYRQCIQGQLLDHQLYDLNAIESQLAPLYGLFLERDTEGKSFFSAVDFAPSVDLDEIGAFNSLTVVTDAVHTSEVKIEISADDVTWISRPVSASILYLTVNGAAVILNSENQPTNRTFIISQGAPIQVGIEVFNDGVYSAPVGVSAVEVCRYVDVSSVTDTTGSNTTTDDSALLQLNNQICAQTNILIASGYKSLVIPPGQSKTATMSLSLQTYSQSALYFRTSFALTTTTGVELDRASIEIQSEGSLSTLGLQEVVRDWREWGGNTGSDQDTNLQKNYDAAETNSSDSKKNYVWLIAVITLGMLVFGVGAYYLWPGKGLYRRAFLFYWMRRNFFYRSLVDELEGKIKKKKGCNLMKKRFNDYEEAIWGYLNVKYGTKLNRKSCLFMCKFVPDCHGKKGWAKYSKSLANGKIRAEQRALIAKKKAREKKEKIKLQHLKMQEKMTKMKEQQRKQKKDKHDISQYHPSAPPYYLLNQINSTRISSRASRRSDNHSIESDTTNRTARLHQILARNGKKNTTKPSRRMSGALLSLTERKSKWLTARGGNLDRKTSNLDLPMKERSKRKKKTGKDRKTLITSPSTHGSKSFLYSISSGSSENEEESPFFLESSRRSIASPFTSTSNGNYGQKYLEY